MSSAETAPIKILIVDDEAGVRELLKDALKLAGFETQAANDGMSALTTLRSYTPDIMIIDMPPGTGDVYLTIAEKFPIDGVIMVSTPQRLAIIDALKSIDCFKKLHIPIIGMIENMAYLTIKEGWFFKRFFNKKFIFFDSYNNSIIYTAICIGNVCGIHLFAQNRFNGFIRSSISCLYMQCNGVFWF